MVRVFVILISTAQLLATATTALSAETTNRYLAVFSNGERHEGGQLTDWHDADSTPVLDSVKLEGEDRELRWFRDRSPDLLRQPSDEEGVIWFVNGDRLPGRVVAFHSSDENGIPGHFLIQTTLSLNDPLGTAETQLIRIRTDFVSGFRSQQQSQSDLESKSIALANGRRRSYRKLDWSRDGVRLLTNDGAEQYSFNEIEQISLPEQNSWTSYFKELAILSPNLSARLLRLSTVSGLTLTGSELKFDAMAIASPEELRRAKEVQSILTRLEQRKRDILSKQKIEQKKLTQKLAEYQRKYDQQIKKLETDLRNMRRRMKNIPADEVDRRVNDFDKRNRKRIEDLQTRLTKNYETIVARNIKRHNDRADDIDKQMTQAKQERTTGENPGESVHRWYHKIQPAWSLDPLWVRFDTIRTRWSFAPHEVPLSRIAPKKVVQRSAIGGNWPWKLDRNVLGGPLRSGGREHGWGIGVHATNELHFEIPTCATSFRTLVGLDEIVSGGGCIRAEVSLHQKDTKEIKFRSDVLAGSEKVLDTSDLNLGSRKEHPATLVLVIDAANRGRPASSDPLDIRDHANWLEPILELEKSLLLREVQKYIR